MPAAIVLAAGEGRRMGGPKALLLVDGEPLIRRHVLRLQEAGCASIVVVVRHAFARQVRATVGDVDGVRLVAADTASPAASLATGLEALSPAREAIVLVTPVDMLPCRRSTIDALVAAVAGGDVLVATPQHRGRGGHPVAARGALLSPFREGYAGTLRDVVRAAEARRRRVDVDDAAIRGDLDAPSDLRALRPGLVPTFAA